MYETLKLSLLNWQVDGIYLPVDCAYIIGNRIIDEHYQMILFKTKFEIIKDKLFLSISPKVLPRHRVIRNCILKWYNGPFHGQQQLIKRVYNENYRKYGVIIFIDFQRKVRQAIGRHITFNWHTLNNAEELEKVIIIVNSLGEDI